MIPSSINPFSELMTHKLLRPIYLLSIRSRIGFLIDIMGTKTPRFSRHRWRRKPQEKCRLLPLI